MKKIYSLLLIFVSGINLNAQDISFAGLSKNTHNYIGVDSNFLKVFVEEGVVPEDVGKPADMSPIATDRPDQTECPFLVPVKMFQIETGYAVENDKSHGERSRNYTYNTSLIKYGVSRNWEFRLIAEYLGTTISNVSTERKLNHMNGMNSLALGTKIFICEERGLIPKTALLAHLELPYFGSPIYKVKHLAPRFRFSMQHTLSKRFSFSYNVGGEWDGTSQDATIIYTASLGANVIGNLNMFVEAYGFMTENSTTQNEFSGSFTQDHRLDGGFTYLVSNNLQLDVSGGVGISQISPDSFLSGGLSWRFK